MRARLVRQFIACALLASLTGLAAVEAARVERVELRLPESGELAAATIEVVGMGPWSKPRIFGDGFDSGDVAEILRDSGGKVTLQFAGGASTCSRFDNRAGWRGQVYSSVEMLFKAPDGGAVMRVELDKAKPFGVKCDVHPWITSIMFETFRVEGP